MSDITVIGGANIDIFGKVDNELVLKDSNPGHISLSFGGVGRNIATNCALLGKKVSFVTVFSNNPFGKMLKEDFLAHHIDISASETVYDNASIYLALLNKENDMQVAVSDMHILDHLKTDTVQSALDKVKDEDLLIADTNLNIEILDYIFKHKKGTLAVDPISTAKALKIKDHLSYIDVFKPNYIEAKTLSNIIVKDNESALAMINYFMDKGVKEILISIGTGGILFGDKNHKLWIKHSLIDCVNSTGAGDSFLAGYLAFREKGALEALRYAIASSMITIASPYTVNEDLNQSECEKLINKIKVEEINLCTLE